MNYDEPQGIWAGLAQCPFHTTEDPAEHDYPYDADCGRCNDEIAQRNEIVNTMGADGQHLTTSLARQGLPSPEGLFLNIRIETMIDSMFSDPRTRVKFEGEVGRRTILALREAEIAVARQRLSTLATPEQRLTVVKNRPRQP